MTVYLGMDQAALDAGYNNTTAVADSARYIADWERRSAEVAARYPQHLDARYGQRERNRIDFFPAARNAPVLAFIHGGYWQMRAKELFRFLATGPLAHGVSFANVGYTLAPDATLAEIVEEVRGAITWIADNASRHGIDARRLFVSGWSAGGHLTAMSLTHPAVRGGLAISGIYDLEPIRHTYLNAKLRLAESDIAPLSPLHNLPQSSPPLYVTYGTGELDELQRQSREYAGARANAGLPGRLAPLEWHNHFSILEELAMPEGMMMRLLLELIG